MYQGFGQLGMIYILSLDCCGNENPWALRRNPQGTSYRISYIKVWIQGSRGVSVVVDTDVWCQAVNATPPQSATRPFHILLGISYVLYAPSSVPMLTIKYPGLKIKSS